MSMEIDRDWEVDAFFGAEEAELVRTYMGLELAKVDHHSSQLEELLFKGKPLQNDEAVFRALREYVVAKFVYYFKIQEDEFDPAQAKLMEDPIWMYYGMLWNQGETAEALYNWCGNQLEILAGNDQGDSQVAMRWRMIGEAMGRYCSTLTGEASPAK